jgi:hypothetical protein
MSSRTATFSKPTAVLALLGALLLGATIAYAAEPDAALSDWLGREITIDTTTLNDHIPLGGKLTFVSDAEEGVVRICTRNVLSARASWRMDLAPGCNVALTFTRGTRYCTVEDVRAGNAEVLSSCHRLRSQNVAMHPAAQKGAVELHDVMIFLIEASNGRKAIQILIDSPARVTHGGNAGGHG